MHDADDVERNVRWSPSDTGGFVLFEQEDDPSGRYRLLRLVDQDGNPAQGTVLTRLDGSLALIEFGPDEDEPEPVPLIPPKHWWNDVEVPAPADLPYGGFGSPDDWDDEDDGSSWFTVGVGYESGRVWIPATVPVDVVLHRDENIAVWLSCFRVTPERMSFELEARYGSDAPRIPKAASKATTDPPKPAASIDDAPSIDELSELWSADTSAGQTYYEQSVGLTVGLAFGDKSAEYSESRRTKAEGMALWPDSGGSGGGHHHASLHCSSLPEGETTFWVEWERFGLERIETTINGDVFQEAAARATLLWESPDPHEGLPPGVPLPPWTW